ncbi:MAG: DUF2520 domain-containing protein [Betaproteobacteria bacterium]|nr:DUF2520 domain-containing protein [Betaproteobacteria bacterium]
MPTLNLIGAGRVGQTLAHLWTRHGVLRVQDVLTRSPDSAQSALDFIAPDGASARVAEHIVDMRPAHIWLLAVPDAQIGACAQNLAAHARQRGDAPALAFHCSGAQGAELLAPVRDLGWSVASAHPVLSFASAHTAVAQFTGTPCALEGDAAACATLRPLFTAIGAACFDVRSQDKVLYHAAAVLATNFAPVLQALAEDAWRATGMPDALVLRLRKRLLRNAVDNIVALGPQQALTGPAARGDHVAIARQADVVADWDPQAAAAYRALSDLALRMAGHACEPPQA